jgi:hypothetical protein
MAAERSAGERRRTADILEAAREFAYEIQAALAAVVEEPDPDRREAWRRRLERLSAAHFAVLGAEYRAWMAAVALHQLGQPAIPPESSGDDRSGE